MEVSAGKSFAHVLFVSLQCFITRGDVHLSIYLASQLASYLFIYLSTCNMCEIVGQYHIPAESTAPAMVLVNQVALGLVAQHLHKSFHNKKILCNLQNWLHTYYLIKLFHGDIISYHIMNIYEYISIYIHIRIVQRGVLFLWALARGSQIRQT